MKKNRFTKDNFQNTLLTIAIEDYFQCVQLTDGTIIKLHLIDTAGQEKFNSIVANYYKTADCCLLVYDITNKESFEKIQNYYIPLIKENKNIRKIVLLGNKADLENQRNVSKEEGSQLAEKNEYVFMESSCKENINVSDAFTTLVEMTNTELKKFIKSDTFKLRKSKKSVNNPQKKKKCCD